MNHTKATSGWAAQGQPATGWTKHDEQSTTASARLTVAEAARYCGVSESYMNKLRCIGGGAVHILLGRRVVYDTRDLDAWLASGRRTSTSDPGKAA